MGSMFMKSVLRYLRRNSPIGWRVAAVSMLMILGFGLLSGLAFGLENRMRAQFVGDVLIVAKGQPRESVLYPSKETPLMRIDAIAQVMTLLENQPFVRHQLPVAKQVFMRRSDMGDLQEQPVFVTDLDAYRRLFLDPLVLRSGEFITSDNRGVLLPVSSDVLPVSALTFLDVRSNPVVVPVVGSFDYSSYKKLWGDMALLDVVSYRELLGESVFDKELVHHGLLGNTEEIVWLGDVVPSGDVTAVIFDNFVNPYNQILLKLNPKVSPVTAQKRLNSQFEALGLSVEAMTWWDVVGPVFLVSPISRSLLVILGGCVVFFAVKNRVDDALPAELVMLLRDEKTLGRRMRESVFFSFVFGSMGVVIGLLILAGLRGVAMTAKTPTVDLLFGGTAFAPQVGVLGVLGTVFLCLSCAVLASFKIR
jgi:hypothetical protein